MSKIYNKYMWFRKKSMMAMIFHVRRRRRFEVDIHVFLKEYFTLTQLRAQIRDMSYNDN